ncbi:hypothetical protein ABKV19_025504 [Rosa sericea]
MAGSCEFRSVRATRMLSLLCSRKVRVLDNKIPVLENLGATEDQFDTIDLSDNEIVKLENLPYLNRLGTLIINNNRITRINPNIGFLAEVTYFSTYQQQGRIEDGEEPKSAVLGNYKKDTGVVSADN